MKIATTLVFLTTIPFYGIRAVADVICTASNIADHSKSLCFSIKIPNEDALLSKFTCSGYKITVDCKYTDSNTLTLLVVSPEGLSESTSATNEVELVDLNGNGASISCVTQ